MKRVRVGGPRRPAAAARFENHRQPWRSASVSKEYRTASPRSGRPLAWLIVGALLVWMGGCPIDRNEVLTETTRAALQAALNSFIEKLGEQLAGS